MYFGLNYSSLFCVVLVSGRRRIYSKVSVLKTEKGLRVSIVIKARLLCGS